MVHNPEMAAADTAGFDGGVIGLDDHNKSWTCANMPLLLSE